MARTLAPTLRVGPPPLVGGFTDIALRTPRKEDQRNPHTKCGVYSSRPFGGGNKNGYPGFAGEIGFASCFFFTSGPQDPPFDKTVQGVLRA